MFRTRWVSMQDRKSTRWLPLRLLFQDPSPVFMLSSSPRSFSFYLSPPALQRLCIPFLCAENKRVSFKHAAKSHPGTFSQTLPVFSRASLVFGALLLTVKRGVACCRRSTSPLPPILPPRVGLMRLLSCTLQFCRIPHRATGDVMPERKRRRNAI